MATTSSNLVAGKLASGGQGGNGKGTKGRVAGLVATAALGLSLLGGLVFSQVHAAAQPTSPSGAVNPIVGDNGVIPGPFTYREDHRTLVSTHDWEQQERMLVAPGGFVTDQFTYREDHRTLAGILDWEQQERTIVAPGGFIPNPFTYREDHRTLPSAALQGWTGTCRAGSSDCLPDEEIVVPAQSVASPHGWTGTCRAGSSDCLPDEDILIGGSAQAGALTTTIVSGTHGTGPADEYADR